jgi:rRNA-processing protein FCF1
MSVVVNDANTLIDMLEIEISDEFFRLPFETHTTDFVSAEIKGEISNKFQNYVRKKLIDIYSLSSEELDKVVNLSNSYPPLSQSDCSFLWLCQHLSATLLTGDKQLKKIASRKNIPIHGSIWIFKQLIFHGEISPRIAAIKLKELMKINDRLPENECRKKIKEWESL